MPHRLPIYAILCILTAISAAWWFAAHQQCSDAAQAEPPVAQSSRLSHRHETVTAKGNQVQQPATSAAPQAALPAQSATQAEALLLSAIAMCENRRSLSARLRFEAQLFGKQLVGSGNYLEENRSEDYLIRLELRTQTGQYSSTLVQVCDGRYLWTYRKMPSETTLTRVDLVRASTQLRRHSATPVPPDSAILPGLGGLAYLLRSLHAAFEFHTLEYGRWGNSGRLVWRLTGQWNRRQLQLLLPDQCSALEKGLPADVSKLPDHLPDQVIMILGQEDLLPYRIEYRRRLPEKEGNEPISRPLLLVDLFDVQTNLKLDPVQFIYQPGNAKFADATESFVQALLRAE